MVNNTDRTPKSGCPSFGMQRPSGDCSAPPGATPPLRSAAITGGDYRCRESVMQLIIYYVVFMIVGDLGAYVTGLVTERIFGSQVSLIVFLTLYFLFLWISWVLAVWVTEPKHAATVTTKSA